MGSDCASSVVERGTVDHATPATAKAMRNRLAFRSHGKHNGDAVTADSTFRYVVYWLRTPRGPHAALFRGLWRNTWQEPGDNSAKSPTLTAAGS
jgi:hypothetical protein